MKKILLFVFSIVCFLALTSSVFALGITPGRYEVNYEPGKQQTFIFKIDGEVVLTNINITGRGDLVNNLALTNEIISLGPGDSKEISAVLTMPETLAPGRHVAEIVVAELPPGKHPSGLSAVVAVVGQIFVIVPYPEKYAEVSGMNAEDVAIGQKVPFTVTFKNYGEQEIQSVAGTVDIYDFYTNASVASAPFDAEQNVASMEQRTLYAYWDTTNAKSGTYVSFAHVLYDGISANEDRMNFRVGDKLVKIVNVDAQNQSSNKINRISVDAESEWNAPLATFAQFTISSEGKTIDDVKSPTTILNPWGSDRLDAFWDATNAVPGTYDLKTVLYYEGETTESNIQINVTKGAGGGAGINLPPEQLAILALVVLVVAFGLLIARKKGRRRITQQYWPRYG